MDLHPLEFYNANAEQYAEQTMALDVSHLYDKFLPHLPAGAHILDVGCGSGRDSLHFIKQGYKVTAFDGSPEIVEQANTILPIKAKVMLFDEMDFAPKSFDGIWACASLLHLMAEELPGMLKQLRTYLKDEGVFFCSFKLGKGLRTDNRGRRFLDMSEQGLRKVLEECGYGGIDVFTNDGVGGEVWVNGVGGMF
ncbi:bifunctional 2-polyprenyl-6-hydroxyphenol methylase/3-demethylubiquinol 3-O-methyltransferase UbiG [Desulfovibrio sp. JC010]|uniref:class I SAM-dependent methyltransferase n=1 Tax=Desulfovibrio sp. JC010 TaxID=2593641 RepID=UPI0013D16547|nr:class I SAM-dependent methyltransferase [Desulfovibrio sp. JC010]NDV26884.1 methyltransferase domain-containing protein [Desulfovibrio sp. JC010]